MKSFNEIVLEYTLLLLHIRNKYITKLVCEHNYSLCKISIKIFKYQSKLCIQKTWTIKIFFNLNYINEKTSLNFQGYNI